jgi:FkbM family methyltransferase
MAAASIPESFYMYLWRSPQLPGTLYLAQGFEATEELCRGLTEDGFIVKLVHTATNAEFELSAGRLCPSAGALPREVPAVVPGGRALDVLAAVLRPLQFRGKERLANAILPRSGRRSTYIFGARFSLDLSDFIQRHIYAGSYERLETQRVRGILRPGMTFVDIGANVGYYTALAASAVGPEGRVLAFEPSRYAFPRLQRMIAANHLSSVTVFACGLADTPGETILYGGAEDDLLNNHTATMVPNDNPHRSTVEIDTLDRVAERLGIRHIDLVKIDVDGYEMRVLLGASGLLRAGCIDNLLLECNEHWFGQANTSRGEISDYLESNGFRTVSRIGRSDNYLFTR